MGDGGAADAVFNALRMARMRVPPSALKWVVELIGPERAAMCECLPRAFRAKAISFQLNEPEDLSGEVPSPNPSSVYDHVNLNIRMSLIPSQQICNTLPITC